MAAAFTVGWGRRRKRSRDLPAQYGGERYLRKLLSFEPIGLWPLRGDGNDRSGNGFHGSSVNGVFEAGSGADGKAALYFNGSTAYFDVYSAALAAAFNGDELCIGGWFKQDAAALSDGVWHDLPVFYNSSSTAYLFMRSLNGSLYVMRTAEGVSKGWSPLSSGFGSDWRHVLLRFTLAGDALQVYLDGSLLGITVSGNAAWSGGLLNTGALFGASPGTSKIHLWQGHMQYLGIYPVLSASQIAEMAVL